MTSWRPDPEALDSAAQARPGLRSAKSVWEAAADADLVLHLTDWDEYRRIDPSSWPWWWRGATSSTPGRPWTSGCGGRRADPSAPSAAVSARAETTWCCPNNPV